MIIYQIENTFAVSSSDLKFVQDKSSQPNAYMEQLILASKKEEVANI